MKIFTNAVSAFSLLAILILVCCHVLEFPCSHVRQSSFIVPMIPNTNIVELTKSLTLFTCTLQDAIHQHLSTSLFRGFVGQCCLCCKPRGACLKPCEWAFRRAMPAPVLCGGKLSLNRRRGFQKSRYWRLHCSQYWSASLVASICSRRIHRSRKNFRSPTRSNLTLEIPQLHVILNMKIKPSSNLPML